MFSRDIYFHFTTCTQHTIYEYETNFCVYWLTIKSRHKCNECVRKGLRVSHLSYFTSTSQVIFACLLYICGHVVVNCGAISFQSELFWSMWSRTIYPHCSLLATAPPCTSTCCFVSRKRIWEVIHVDMWWVFSDDLTEHSGTTVGSYKSMLKTCQ